MKLFPIHPLHFYAFQVMLSNILQIGTKVWLKPRPAFPFDPYGDYEGWDLGNAEWLFTALMPILGGQLAGLSGKVTAGQLTNNNDWRYYESIIAKALLEQQNVIYYNRDIYKPAVGINYILLDEQFKYVPEGSGFVDAENNTTMLQPLTTGQMVVQKSGYLSVTTQVTTPSFNAYFDNLSILQRSGPLLQESDTYAFGGSIDALESRSFGRAENKYGYNGKEKQPDLGLEWLDYGARMYDAQVGRWHAVDPLSQKYASFSPYHFVSNNPIRFIEVDGRLFEDSKHQVVAFKMDDKGNIQWGKNATSDLKRMGSLMSQTEAGRKVLNDMNASKIKISMEIDTKTVNNDNGTFTRGKTSYLVDSKGNVVEAHITVFEATVKEQLNYVGENGKIPVGDKEYNAKDLTVDNMLGSEGVHEGTHPTDKNSNKFTNSKATAEEKEKKPDENQQNHIDENLKKEKKG